MTSIRITAARWVAGLLALVAPLVATATPAVAVGTTRYVAASGSVGTGQSCASPGYVGANETSIQAAINAASAGDTVYVCAGTYAVSPRLTITKNLTLSGAGEQTTILDGQSTNQILYVPDQSTDITVSISGFTFKNGLAGTRIGGECDQGSNCGGAIFVGGGTEAHISDSYFTENQAMFGGAVAFVGNHETTASTIKRSTFEANRSDIDGGAILVLANNGLTMDRITVVGNKLVTGDNPRSGMGIVVNFASATMKNSTVVNNTEQPWWVNATTIYVNGSFTINNSILANEGSVQLCTNAYNTSLVGMTTGNLVTDNTCAVSQSYPPASTGQSSITTFANLKLGTLSYRGYDSKTMPLLAGSVALNYHSNSCSGSDQIGTSVPQGTRCDTGAYERSASQTLNTPTGWAYPSSSIDRGYSSTMAASTPATDPAGRGVTYASSTSGVCSISSSGTITAIANGTCTVSATGPGWLTRDEDSVTQTVTVTQTPANSTTTSTSSTTSTSTTSTTSTTVAQNPSTTTTVSPVQATTTSSVAAAPGSTTTTAGPTVAEAGPTTTLGTATTLATSQEISAVESATAPQVRRDASTEVVPVSSTTVAATTTTTVAVETPDAPGVEPGAAAASVDGEPIETDLERLNNSYVVSGAGLNVTVSGLSADGSQIALDADGTLRLESGDSVVIDAAGYSSGTEIETWMFSTPTKLGTMTADARGKVSATFSVPSTIEAGNHRLVLSGKNSNGADVVLSVGLALGEYEAGGTVKPWMIAFPIAAAIIVAVVIPTTLRRRRKIRVGA